MFVKRCDDSLSEDMSKQYDKCDSDVSDSLKETVKNCAKDLCKDKSSKMDVCCYTVKPNQMFACFEKNIHQNEVKEANKKGETIDEFHRKNVHNAAKIMECYEEIDDDDDDDD
ncbi:uncharacterized protein LOC128961464 [Oppia nitens]|uniref:uncharacterized protein LOC128961464 n=1 Tax=Oppia nitens TaxID=1686743 RepID=UPI0023DAE386|nr:uncharacterized protein LOC128961464 [Oppia nitens]